MRMASLSFYSQIVTLLMAAGCFTIILTASNFLLDKAFDLIDKIIIEHSYSSKNRMNEKRIRDASKVFERSLNTAGIITPITAFVFLTAATVYYHPFEHISLAVCVYFLWTTSIAIQMNTNYHIQYGKHCTLLARYFFSNFIGSQNTRNALSESYAMLPSGDVKTATKRCYTMAKKGAPWEEAVRVYSANMFSGRAVSTYLNLYENYNDEVSDEIVAAFIDGIEQDAEIMVQTRNKTRNMQWINLILSVIFTGVSAFLIYIDKDLTTLGLVGLVMIVVFIFLSNIACRNLIVSRRII